MEKQVKVAIGIQARSTSTRLPNKVSEFVGNKMIIDHIAGIAKNSVEYINRYTYTNHVVASSFVLIPKSDPLKDLLEIMADSVIEGDENDVLSRYVQMAKQSDASIVVRITADCPVMPPHLIFKCINTLIKNGLDYMSNVGDIDDHGKEYMRTSIDGHDVEVMSIRALEWADKNATSPKEREHVTTVLRNDKFPYFLRKGLLVCHNDLSKIKLSVDTIEDLQRVREDHDTVQRIIATAKKKKISIHRY